MLIWTDPFAPFKRWAQALCAMVCFILFSPLLRAQEGDKDWPTYRHDNQRSGQYPHDLPEQLQLQWSFKTSHPPKEAWAGTAQSDIFHRRESPEPKRNTFDKAFEVVSAHGRVYFGSSADDQLRCLDLKTGKQLWTFFAEGPIRLAPTIAEERLFFGADDGRVYCLNAITGKLLWRSSIPEAEQRRIPGNGRMISLYPVRTGILVNGESACFGCGIFPKSTGVWYCSLDIKTGEILDRQSLKTSLQGYLEERKGEIFAHTGRDRKGVFLEHLPSRKEKIPPKIRGPLKAAPYTSISTPSQIIEGRDGRVAIVKGTDGAEIWSQQVEGRARSLAISQDQLLVSTESGMIYCYAAQSASIAVHHTPQALEPLKQASTQTLAMLDHLPCDKGYALVLNAADDEGALIIALAEQSELQLVGVVEDASKADALRAKLAQQHLYGSRISIHHIPRGELLAYASRTFNLITATTNLLKDASIVRLLRPQTGILWQTGMNRPLYTAPALKGIGEWTHMYADAGNTACSNDSRIGSDLRLQWFGRPGPQQMIDRHLRSTPSLVKNGLLFIPGRDYIFGVDAWNGTILWEKNIPDFRRIGALRDSGNMVLSDDLLYSTTASKCRGFDTYSGQEKLSLALPALYSEEKFEWGYSAVSGRSLIGSVVKKGGVYREMSFAALYDVNYRDNNKIACSDALFVLDRHTGKQFWIYQPKGSIFNPSISISDHKVMFIESANPETLQQASARMHYPILLEKAGADLVCLDLEKGIEQWRIPLDQRTGIQTLFTLAKDGYIAVVNSRNHTAENASSATVHYDISVFKTTNGALAWKNTKNHKKRPNLNHGEQDRHPTIVGDRLIAEPHIYELRSGKELGEFNRGKRGCGTISASSSSLYFRAGNLAFHDLNKGQGDRITAVTRPGCWINMIPAGGLLLVPEGSSGCICNYAVQGSMAFAPVGE